MKNFIKQNKHRLKTLKETFATSKISSSSQTISKKLRANILYITNNMFLNQLCQNCAK